jgi:hypothetical protein
MSSPTFPVLVSEPSSAGREHEMVAPDVAFFTPSLFRILATDPGGRHASGTVVLGHDGLQTVAP